MNESFRDIRTIMKRDALRLRKRKEREMRNAIRNRYTEKEVI